jgi:hypothetical protein
MRSSGHCLTITTSSNCNDSKYVLWRCDGDLTRSDLQRHNSSGPLTVQDRSRRRRPRLSRPLSPASRDKRSVRWAMFAEPAKSKIVSARQASCVALAHCNRDKLIAPARLSGKPPPKSAAPPADDDRQRVRMPLGHQACRSGCNRWAAPMFYMCPRASCPYPLSYRAEGREKTCQPLGGSMCRWMNSET